MQVKIVERADLGKAFVDMLSKVQVSLKEDISTGTLLDYGSGIKEWVHTIDTRFSKNPEAISNTFYMYLDYMNITLPFTPREIINIQCNLETDDIIINKSCAGKKNTANSVRLDYAGMSKNGNLNQSLKNVKIHLRILCIV